MHKTIVYIPNYKKKRLIRQLVVYICCVMIFLFFPILYIENTKRYTQNNMYDSDGQIAGIYTEKDKNDESSSTQTGNLVKLPLIVRTFNLNNIVDIYYLSGIALVFFGISFLILSLQYFLKR